MRGKGPHSRALAWRVVRPEPHCLQRTVQCESAQLLRFEAQWHLARTDLGASRRNDGACELETARSAKQFFQRDPQLQATEWSAGAMVGAAAESEVVVDVVAVKLELISTWELAFIAIGRRIHECDRLARLDRATPGTRWAGSLCGQTRDTACTGVETPRAQQG